MHTGFTNMFHTSMSSSSTINFHGNLSSSHVYSALGARKIARLNTTKDSTRRTIINSLCFPCAKACESDKNFRFEIEHTFGEIQNVFMRLAEGILRRKCLKPEKATLKPYITKNGFT